MCVIDIKTRGWGPDTLTLSTFPCPLCICNLVNFFRINVWTRVCTANGSQLRPVFHVRDFFGAESHDHQCAIYCHFHEHLNHAKVYHVIQVVRVSKPVNFHSSETRTRAHMVWNNEYNNTNTLPTRNVEWFRSNKRHSFKQQIDDHFYLLITL